MHSNIKDKDNHNDQIDKITISLPHAIKKWLDREIRPRERSHYIANAIRDSLIRDAQHKALEKVLQFKPYTVAENSSDVIRKLRENRAGDITGKRKSTS